jgi:tRNA threonylcarbamoyl adenosine modification protein YeaZ
MTILALEFSAELRSAAVLVEGATPSCATEQRPREHGPFALIERALAAAGVEREQIDCIAIGLGPGSYTGIRAAIAVAQGWNLGRQVRLVGLSSMEVLAEQAQAAGACGSVSFVVDAQRGEIYWAKYSLGSAERTILQPLRLATWDELDGARDAGEPIFGPDPKLSERGVQLLMPSAAILAGQALGPIPEVPPAQFEPIYLRPISFVKAPPPRAIPPRPGG